LSQLVKGNWIAGTTSRFVENGKTLVTTREKIFVHNVTDIASSVKLMVYDVSTIHNIFDDASENGFSVLLMPGLTEIHNEYSINCTNYSNFGIRAVCGWISVIPIYSDYERNEVSLVFSGETGMSYTNAAVVMHVELPAGKFAEIHAFSPFKPDEKDTLIFENTEQQIENVLVNGVKQNFRQYLIDRKIDRSNKSHNMLAGTHSSGLIMNITIFEESENDQEKFVSVGAPVYKGIPYCLAKMDNETCYDDVKKFNEQLVFSLSCITNYVCPEIFLDHLTHTSGPFAYGEIAYFLLNHATVYVTIGNLD